MSFTSLLPSPKHSESEQSKEATQTRRNQEHVLNALVHHDNELIKTMPESDTNLDSIVAQKLTFQDIIPMRQRNFNLHIPKPSSEDIEEAYRRTKRVFEKVLSNHLQKRSTTVKSSKEINDSAYELRYDTVQPSGARRTRILTVVDQAKDPLQPNTIKATKVVAPTDEEDITPILHKTLGTDPTEILSKEDRDMWKIPAAISSWKNPKGYTIALEKRLEMDGRFSSEQLEGHKISDGFSKLSAALESADRKARQEIKLRAEAKRQLAEEETIKKEERLMSLARKAREDREQYRNLHNAISSHSPENDNETQRNFSREKRKQELQHGIRKSKMSTADRLRELAYSQGRDISERVILSAAKVTESKEANYDSRLFSKGANAQAKRHEEQLYDQPLFAGQNSSGIYRGNLEQVNSTGSSAAQNSGIGETIHFTKADNDTLLESTEKKEK